MDDARYFEMNGRRWRRQDPGIPPTLATELVGALMAARRAVQQALRSDDANALRAARAQVQDAKLALGERGAPWWENPTPAQLSVRGAATVRSLLRRRGAGKTICPSDAARVLAGSRFRSAMPAVRALVTRMEAAGELMVLQKGKRVHADQVRGPIRLALPEAADAPTPSHTLRGGRSAEPSRVSRSGDTI